MAVDREKVTQAAQKFVEKKRYDKAVEEFQKILAEDPRDVRTLLRVGDVRLKAEQYPDAITTYETVGQFYLQQKQLPKALAVYKQVREIIKKHVPHLEDRFGHVVPKLAEIYSQLGYMGDALATYDELAARLQAAGRDRDVIDVFRKVADLDPSNPLPLLRLADAFMRVRDIDAAIQKLAAAAEQLVKLGRRDEALKVVERLLQHRQDPQYCRLAAEIYLERAGPNDGMAALTKLQTAFKDNPRDLETLGLLARSFDVLGQTAKSIEVQKEAARIAKEAGKLDTFSGLVDTLLARAPNDEGVRSLAALRSKTSRPPSQSELSIPPMSVSVQSVPPSAPVDVRKLSAAAAARIDQGDPRSSYDVEVDIDDEPMVDESRPVPMVQPAPHAALHDPTVRARYIASQAEALRRDRNYDEAIAVLEGGIDALPDARDLREKLCDLLIEAGDQARAIYQMLAFAQRLAETNDVETAARVLDEVLLLEPGHAEATAMLGDLGYAVAPVGEAAADGGYDPNAPLPAWDIDEAPPAAAQFESLDDPFGGDMPLPRFDMDEEGQDEEERTVFQPGNRASFEPPAPNYPPYGTGPYAPVRAPSTPPQSVRIPAPPTNFVHQSFDEAALDEVEFFASQGMFDEARNLLEEQLARLPNHPLLLERKRELEAMAGSPNESGARVAPRSGLPAPMEDRSFDIARSLDALDALEEHASPLESQQISVESVFEQFKAGVAAQVSETDGATHYDLGVAYKEMGLFTDAISEFEVASRDPARECVCQSMIGMLHMQLGNIPAGIDALTRSLRAQYKTREQELALLYEIGDAYEAMQTRDQALHYFQRLAKIEPKYFDPRGTISERMRRLDVPKGKPPARAVGQDLVTDDFDNAFDELLGGGKLP